jgi:transposase
MAHGLNANLVHKWRREAQRPARATAAFVPVAVEPTAVVSEPPQHIELEVHRGAVTVRVRWPMTSTASCAAWLREILR